LIICSYPLGKDDVAAARRKKMSKLSRTLGENVPPELVFGLPPTYHRAEILPSKPHRQRGASISHVTFARHVESSRSSLLAFAHLTDGPFNPIPSAPRASFDSEYSDATEEEEWVHANDPTKYTREEDTWKGEWNRRSMGEIKMRLRALKA
jgi:hypothetical protein